MSCFVLTGDRDACRHRVTWYRTGFHKKYGTSAPIEVLDVEDTSLERVQDTLWGQSLFAEKRMVILRGIPLSTTTKKKEHIQIEEYLLAHWDELDEETVYLFVSPDADKRRSLMKRCTKEKIVEVCTPMEGTALTTLVQQRIPNINSSLAREIVTRANDQEAEVRNTIDKLLLYAGDEPITTSMIATVTKRSDTPDIFGLMDALATRNLKKSTSALHILLQAGEDPFMILSMCIRQFRIMYALSEATDTQGMIKALKLHPFVAKKTLQHVKSFPKSLLKKGFLELHTLDQGVKTGVIRTATDDQKEMQIALERFIVGVCVGF